MVVIQKSSKIFYVHMVSWDFLMELGCSMRQFIASENIPFEQKGNNFYVLGADGQRTGEVYALVSEATAYHSRKVKRQLL